MDSEFIVQPTQMIRQEVEGFVQRVSVWAVTLFTVDGYVLSYRSMNERIPEESELALSSMSAGLITIAEDMIRMVDPAKIFSQIVVDAEDNNHADTFSIILKHIADNVLLACVFPNSLHLGLVTFEIHNLSQAIREIVNNWDVKLHDETVT